MTKYKRYCQKKPKKNRKIFQQYYENKKKGYENWSEVDA